MKSKLPKQLMYSYEESKESIEEISDNIFRSVLKNQSKQIKELENKLIALSLRLNYVESIIAGNIIFGGENVINRIINKSNISRPSISSESNT